MFRDFTVSKTVDMVTLPSEYRYQIGDICGDPLPLRLASTAILGEARNASSLVVSSSLKFAIIPSSRPQRRHLDSHTHN